MSILVNKNLSEEQCKEIAEQIDNFMGTQEQFFTVQELYDYLLGCLSFQLNPDESKSIKKSIKAYLQKLSSNATCTNLGRKPGWNGWYGEGQLYAYLYAKFGLRINLGFFKKDFDIVDAGIGGVLNMGGPKPTYFTGKARVKLRLLNGLVNMNRSFKFECGDRCDLFMGNALDNFQLFGECSIADTWWTNPLSEVCSLVAYICLITYFIKATK